LCFFSGGPDFSCLKVSVSTNSNYGNASFRVSIGVEGEDPVALLELLEAFAHGLQLSLFELDLTNKIIKLHLFLDESDLVEGGVLQNGGDEELLGGSIQLNVLLFPLQIGLWRLRFVLDLIQITLSILALL
jgi:hypothetical protein